MEAVQHTSLRDTAVSTYKNCHIYLLMEEKGKRCKIEYKPKKNPLILSLAQRDLNLVWGILYPFIIAK